MDPHHHSQGPHSNKEDCAPRVQLLNAISALSTNAFTLTLTLVNTLLLVMSNQFSMVDGVCHIHLLHLTSMSRKRKRDSDSRFSIVWFHLLHLMSFLMRKREIACPWYIKPRTIQWFYLFIDWVPTHDPERFKDFFRVSPYTFYYICEMVHEDLVTNPPLPFLTLPNRKLSVERQVAIALRRLCTGDQYLGISEFFGLSTTSVIKVTVKFIEAFNNRGRNLIHSPIGHEMDEVKQHFDERWGIPICCGALDGTHFPVELPKSELSQDYFDFKRKMSVSMQGIVDLKLRFLHVVAGWPGSIQDTRLMQVSSFYKDVEYNRTKLNNSEYFCCDGSTMLREYVIGDAGYPLYIWLMVPYPRGLSLEQDNWNHFHSQARMCIERAFGRLKGTWRILSKILWKPKQDRIGPMIYCCCLLHNLMINCGDFVNPTLLHGITTHPHGYNGVTVPRRELCEGGAEARENLLNEVLLRPRRGPHRIVRLE